MPNIYVKLNNLNLVWLKDEKTFDGALAPLDHIESDGHINPYDALFSDSYAHVYKNGIIKRYGEQIGTVEDLEILEENKNDKND